MNLRDPKVQKILMGVVLVGVVSYLYFGTTFFPFCYQVRRAQITEKEEEFRKLSADLEKARQMVDQLAQLEAEYDRLHAQWEVAQELLPSEQEMPDLLRKVTTAGNKAGVDFMLFQPGPPVVQEFYKTHPVNVRIRGGYHELGIFLSQLANMSRLVNVADLKVTAASAAPKGAKQNNKRKDFNPKDTIIADFTMTAYTLVEGAEYETAAVTEQTGE